MFPGIVAGDGNMHISLILAAATMLLLSITAKASDSLIPLLSRLNESKEPLGFAVASGFRSKHLVDDHDFNEANRGLGLRFEGGWTVGWYYNSIRRHSVYAGREFQWRLLGPDSARLNFGLVVGGVSGYEDGISPGGVKHGIHVALLYIPSLSKTPTTLAAQLRVKF
ncbi:MAG: hypothetical protein CGU28_09335 [Candidatus Dactylopiibacterium carminicum]|uniref:Uncharacterized protein n=1 Tax=Candidatus Dactylopiibacterium carminicum TaxID=857335 RepID=A0A272EQX5_9RHOO|nr:hypothetical protein [Candidatus Dactylopiibacterium carminicum]KAF7598696.1 hypothetical protein BGI27_11870 [Candidatus Dactylopiibacterium carminicum]PAS92513.1 MAG: hypothetical protein CGU29_11265 [Candidatus Dactylopiibacterium carminicum]PAS96310.1 MAG: hypothetical protein CGU28_09335 [Candidatus Dactylopiibacterium carminicum]PAS98563.1 MAG: hypothetical protein BSR46_11885 [Candidatus Dactylopiibacterium carminicum]